MTQVKSLIVLGSEGLQQAFNSCLELTVKAGATKAPTNRQEAVEWINTATTNDMRKARKTLAFGMIYGAGVTTFKKLHQKI